MDKVSDDIKQGFEQIAMRFGPASIQPAVVKSVEADDTITVELSSELEIEGVRLRAVVKDGAKLVIEPKIGSTVQIAAIDNSKEFIVVAVEEFEKITIEKDGLEITIDDKIEIKNGLNSLKSVLDKIIEACQVIVVAQGNNPDYVKLANAKTQVTNLFN
ncbi:MAG TPA: hypothetical protein VK173_07790 [Lacibacter sp.]|nr:hypothetical protein [Lacibacter sp.]